MKFKLSFFLMLFVLTDLSFAVSVYTLDEQLYQTNQTLLRFRIENNSNDTGANARIVAPNAEVVIGQSGKHYFGAIYAKKIVVHQDTKVTWVPFEETRPMLVDNFVIPGVPFYAVNFFERDGER